MTKLLLKKMKKENNYFFIKFIKQDLYENIEKFNYYYNPIIYIHISKIE